MQEPKSNERTFQGIIWNVVNKILKRFEYDFDKYAQQVKTLLKTPRSKAHYMSVYKALVFSENV